jgi:putative hydrolase of the HAD superfamily
MVKAIIFDLDDTLIDDSRSIGEAFRTTCFVASEQYQIDPHLLEEKVRYHARSLYESYPIYPFTRLIGINPFEALWGTFTDRGAQFEALQKIAPHYQLEAWRNGLQAIGVKNERLALELAKAFPKHRMKLPYVFEDTYSVLKQIKDNFIVILLTNGSPSLQQTKLSLTPELIPFFDVIIISGDIGVGKPNPAIFQHALNRVGVSTVEAIMIGDNLHTDILGANRVGLKNVWVNRKHLPINEIHPTYEISELKELIGLLTKL